MNADSYSGKVAVICGSSARSTISSITWCANTDSLFKYCILLARNSTQCKQFPLVRQFGHCLLNMRVSFSRRWPSDNGLPELWKRSAYVGCAIVAISEMSGASSFNAVLWLSHALRAIESSWMWWPCYNVSLRFNEFNCFSRIHCSTHTETIATSVFIEQQTGLHWYLRLGTATPSLLPHTHSHVWIGIRHTSHIQFRLHNHNMETCFVGLCVSVCRLPALECTWINTKSRAKALFIPICI